LLPCAQFACKHGGADLREGGGFAWGRPIPPNRGETAAFCAGGPLKQRSSQAIGSRRARGGYGALRDKKFKKLFDSEIAFAYITRTDGDDVLRMLLRLGHPSLTIDPPTC
jgi:hypothetical protein